MSTKPLDARAVDLWPFCRDGQSAQGVWPLRQLERLASGLATPEPVGEAQWQAEGRVVPVTGGEPEIWLHLQGRAQVDLQCQRCLQTMTEDLLVDRRFRFVHTEAEAARLDEEAEDDVLVLEPRINLIELLEDELILSQPIVPRHAVCPDPLPVDAAPAEDETAPNPFAALAALRGRPPQGGAG